MSLDFFFNDTATTEIYTLSLHDALPICHAIQADAAGLHHHQLAVLRQQPDRDQRGEQHRERDHVVDVLRRLVRSEEHTSELQSRQYLVCRLLLEKKKKIGKAHL